MNSPLMRWLLDLEAIPADAVDLRLAWEHAWPAWMWALLIAAIALLAFWSYHRLAGARWARGVLAAVRATIILLAVVLIAGPMIELPRETVERDWVLVLADRSASMTVADADGAGGRKSRDEQLATLLERHTDTFGKLAEEREVQWLGFHAGAFSLGAPDEPTPGSVPVDLGAPSGQRTSLGPAIEQALQRAAARPISGVVVLSDGRTVEPPGRTLMRRLQADAIPVFSVPLGSPEPLGDLALRRVDAPRRAFVQDKVPVVVEIDRFGSAVREMGGSVKLVDSATGETLDRIDLAPNDDRERVTLTAEPALAGEAAWTVVIETAEPDLIPENNRRPILIELVDRPLRVLYVEGYPRWEYRYLKNLMIREKSIECSVMLLSADRDFAQEGNEPITRLPRSPEELVAYDVVVLGDAPASFFAPDQLDMIRSHVADRGAGLLWIGGSRSTPSTYAGTVLTDLLPMRGGLKLPMLGGPVNMRPTELADRLGVLRIVTAEGVGWPRALVDPSYGGSQLWGVPRIEPGRLKPTAEVLAETVDPVDGAALPLVVHLRYGAGQSIYAATDEIWRWRYGRGELLPDQFWIQMIRMLGRESLATAGDRAVLEVNPRRLEVNQPMRVSLRLLDAQLIESRRSTVAAVLETEDGTRVADLELRRLPNAESLFAATYLPERTGALRVRVNDPAFAPLDLRMPVEVFTPDDELRRPESDHALLEQIASATGGRPLGVDEVGMLPELLPNRAVRTLNPLRERIWDTPLAFALILLVLTGEWIGRKVLRLA
jgi:uncharacterized membrane protein